MQSPLIETININPQHFASLLFSFQFFFSDLLNGRSMVLCKETVLKFELEADIKTVSFISHIFIILFLT